MSEIITAAITGCVTLVEEQIRGMDRRLEQLEQGQRRQPIS